MPISDEFLQYVMDQYEGWGGVSARKMFGGAGLYRDGRMFALVADDVLYLKVDASNRADYSAAGCKQFRPFPGKNTTMPYCESPPELLEDPQELAAWSAKSLAAAAKGKKK